VTSAPSAGPDGFFLQYVKTASAKRFFGGKKGGPEWAGEFFGKMSGLNWQSSNMAGSVRKEKSRARRQTGAPLVWL